MKYEGGSTGSLWKHLKKHTTRGPEPGQPTIFSVPDNVIEDTGHETEISHSTESTR